MADLHWISRRCLPPHRPHRSAVGVCAFAPQATGQVTLQILRGSRVIASQRSARSAAGDRLPRSNQSVVQTTLERFGGRLPASAHAARELGRRAAPRPREMPLVRLHHRVYRIPLHVRDNGYAPCVLEVSQKCANGRLSGKSFRILAFSATELSSPSRSRFLIEDRPRANALRL